MSIPAQEVMDLPGLASEKGYFDHYFMDALPNNKLAGVTGEHPVIAGFATILFSVAAVFLYKAQNVSRLVQFAWCCFFKPIKGSSQSERLDSFYAHGHADIYDATRTALLKGRETMLQLAAAELKARYEVTPNSPNLMRQPRIWVDMGGGTGYNIETMDQFMPIATFDAVYLVDLCEPLLEVARKRFKERRWKNVHVVHCDATKFELPLDKYGRQCKAALITMSYSLSMIPPYHATLDRMSDMLDPKGVMGVVDFYAKRCKTKNPHISDLNLDTGIFGTWFWTTWFSFDHVHLKPERMEYLQYRFAGRKSHYARNEFIVPWLIQIPYYIYLGDKRQEPVPTATLSSQPANFRLEHGLLTPNSPWQKANSQEDATDLAEFSLGASALDDAAQHSIITREVVKQRSQSAWRLPYEEQEVHKEFRTHIYGWTWEDPAVDVEKLKIQDGDSILCITSAGDNVLHYAIKAQVEVHSVDMNPCQGNILELKLAAIKALDYGDFWKIFGQGCHPEFERLLDTKISPYLSSGAYAYWKGNAYQFTTDWFLQGYSGWALRLANFAFQVMGVQKDVQRFISADSTVEQQKIWASKLRWVLLNPIMRTVLASPVFCWNALGVPRNQLSVLLEDGDISSFIAGTFDPLPGLATFKNGAYHYFLCLNGRYTRSSCPLYLTPEGFNALKSRSGAKTQNIRLHTDTILNVLSGLGDGSLTKIIVMDSLDWFDRIDPSKPMLEDRYKKATDTSPEEALESLHSELDHEILEMKRVLKSGGMAVWRSAGKYPWYRQRFELAGFEVEPIDVRQTGVAIDRVNMYASFWKAVKV